MRIDRLYGRHKKKTIYVVGTGPSLRVFPLKFLAGEITIGLNQSWRHFNPTYMLTVHPELYLEHKQLRRADPSMSKLQWIIKKKAPMASLEFTDPTHYVFQTRRHLDVVRNREVDTLYLGEGVQTTAIDLAVRMGAAFVVLVGCDMASLGGEFHGHDQHVRWLGLPADEQYRLYREFTASLRSLVYEAFGVSVLTLSPFVGIAHPGEDYARLKSERKLPDLPVPKDVSPYLRKEDGTGWPKT